MKIRILLVVAIACLVQPAMASLSGNPLTDGWASQGNSLSNGVYVRGDANYGFDTYSATLTVDATLSAATGGSWNVGDTVIGVGGVFADSVVGWTVTGTAVNSLLSNATGPKIQVKFGTDPPGIPWSTSTIAPGAGNGVGSLANGGAGSIQIRSSAYNDAATWTTNAGVLNVPSASHITRDGGSAPLPDVARLIWNVDAGELSSWQILLNVSALGALNPAPGPGSMALMTVQNGDNAITDALLEVPAADGVVPEPTTLLVWSVLALTVGGASLRRREEVAA